MKIKEVPTNGEEYLLKVINERKKISTVTTCNQDYSKFAEKQTCFICEEPNASVPEEFRPTIEWQNIQVADFSDVRLYVTKLLSKKAIWNQNVKKAKFDYANGREWDDFFSKTEPTLSYVLGLPMAALDYGLEYLTDLIGATKAGQTIDHKTGQWIYAFLACTRQPLLSDTISVLRNLARKCAEIRSRLNPEDESARSAVAPLNIFICLVARYFRQYDLAD